MDVGAFSSSARYGKRCRILIRSHVKRSIAFVVILLGTFVATALGIILICPALPIGLVIVASYILGLACSSFVLWTTFPCLAKLTKQFDNYLDAFCDDSTSRANQADSNYSNAHQLINKEFNSAKNNWKATQNDFNNLLRTELKGQDPNETEFLWPTLPNEIKDEIAKLVLR